jgi:hypothetical protein
VAHVVGLNAGNEVGRSGVGEKNITFFKRSVNYDFYGCSLFSSCNLACEKAFQN